MAKKNKDNLVVESKTFLEDLSREELVVRYNDNVATRKALAAENKVLGELYSKAKSAEKTASIEAKRAALLAQLEALKNPSTPVVATPEKVVEVSDLADSLAG
jgi:superfamily I DNA and/or RNA helicase